ncbi:GrpB family protein [Aurantiacibacter poecillastricola]|uniref:GrpB family protein n=1 Tax=Aurantiacibacter poecillastricola TaxID=3064385 RepID=UPI00273FE3EE|nr:GrpB family protein [Aurantiacibacter sp. 219JJ12-13]MDP5260539.1 GrpB family protein [Aurantiacibacter sp. 219JJ12-13]
MRTIRIVSYDPGWPAKAEAEAERILAAGAPALLRVHHIGSTAVPGLAAKPVIDLLAEAAALPELDHARPSLERLGYVWRGENGIAGRRYLTLSDADTGERLVHLHCFASGDPAIARHIAFRDYLRGRPDLASEYARIKRKCVGSSGGDAARYVACKAGWVSRIECEALAAH